jgi:hypothetical protein
MWRRSIEDERRENAFINSLKVKESIRRMYFSPLPLVSSIHFYVPNH